MFACLIRCGRLVSKKKKSLDKVIYQVERREQGERIPAEKSWLSQTLMRLRDEYAPSPIPGMRIITLQYSGYPLPYHQRSHYHGVHMDASAADEPERAK